MNPEVFYLQVSGEQRGPYTIPQIDHLLNSGLITAEALYWREGMEDWLPVTQLVVVRKKVRSWWAPIAAAVAAIVVLIFAKVFGPVTLDGWREQAQYTFTERAAYWRARDIVRRQLVPTGFLVGFHPLKEAQPKLVEEPPGAVVQLRGELTNREKVTKTTAWEVKLRYDRQMKEWTAVSAREIDSKS